MYKIEEWITGLLLLLSAVLKIGSIIALYTAYGQIDDFRTQRTDEITQTHTLSL